MMFAQRRNRLTTHFSERIPVVTRRMIVHLQKMDSIRQYKQTPFRYPPYSTNHANLTSQTSRHLLSTVSTVFLSHLLLSYYRHVESCLLLSGCKCSDDAAQMTFSSIESPKTGMHKSRTTWPLIFMGTQSGTVFISPMWRLQILEDLRIPATNT
jgi:hypothetical protein